MRLPIAGVSLMCALLNVLRRLSLLRLAVIVLVQCFCADAGNAKCASDLHGCPNKAHVEIVCAKCLKFENGRRTSLRGIEVKIKDDEVVWDLLRSGIGRQPTFIGPSSFPICNDFNS